MSEPMQTQQKSKKSESAFRTISEVANDLSVQQHVLRFWETKFSQIRPLKRGGGRRYYRPEDLDLLKTIHHLLYTEGYTIKGVQKLLKENGKNRIIEEAGPEAPSSPVLAARAQSQLAPEDKTALELMLKDLKDLRSLIKNPE